MPDRQPAQIIQPGAVSGSGEVGAFPFEFYERRCLAQGDSWFSIGALPPAWTTRILAELRLLRSTVIVNCAYPGAELRVMTDTTHAPPFRRLLAGKLAMKWDAILLSGGGNDLVAAAGVAPSAPPELRLLRTPQERGAAALSPSDYLSEAGWGTFSAHIGVVFNLLVDLRDSGINRTTPLVWHNYARLMPRPAPAGPLYGPWVITALEQYAVPLTDQLAVADELLARLRRLIDALVAARRAADPQCQLFIADSMSAGLDLAQQGSTGVSGDWVNEIHPTRGGYKKCAEAWHQVLDTVLA
ncbi:MAG TPA: SGNH/GDSL hydrolase family protein [Burkholderiaceae bacterium]|nr:SGNH/GDSL hydrolase family protein [Burkholderiaceae bacterium]